MPTFRLRSAQKLVPIMPKNTRLTGSQILMMWLFKGSNLTIPAMEQIRTAITLSRHWEKSSALADLNWKDDSATLFSRICGGRRARKTICRKRWRAGWWRTLLQPAARRSLEPPQRARATRDGCKGGRAEPEGPALPDFRKIVLRDLSELTSAVLDVQ